jgi:hypothetical protein
MVTYEERRDHSDVLSQRSLTSMSWMAACDASLFSMKGKRTKLAIKHLHARL